MNEKTGIQIKLINIYELYMKGISIKSELEELMQLLDEELSKGDSDE